MARARAALARAGFPLTGWGCPQVDADDVLAHAPRLRAVVHAAGTVKEHPDRAVQERGIVAGSAAWADVIPVAEYTLATQADKGVPAEARESRRRRADSDLVRRQPAIGDCRRPADLVGASRIGRRVLELP